MAGTPVAAGKLRAHTGRMPVQSMVDETDHFPKVRCTEELKAKPLASLIVGDL